MKKLLPWLLILALVFLFGCGETKQKPNQIISLAEIKAELKALPWNYSIISALQDGCFVVRGGELVSGTEVLDRFLADCEQGVPSSLRSVYCTDQGPTGIIVVVYDGEKYYGAEDWTRSVSDCPGYSEFEYKYLQAEEANGMTHVYLVNDMAVTYEMYLQQLLKSSYNPDDRVDLKMVCWYSTP